MDASIKGECSSSTNDKHITDQKKRIRVIESCQEKQNGKFGGTQMKYGGMIWNSFMSVIVKQALVRLKK